MDIVHNEPIKEENKSTSAGFLANHPYPQNGDVDNTPESSHTYDAVVDSVLESEVETRILEKATNHYYQAGTFEECVYPSKSLIKRNRHKHPPPSGELVLGFHENDVLSGRGATINSHPGNVRFRKMCVSRKSEFDIATNSNKRLIATSVVEEVFKLDPPGRFLERVNDATAAAFEEQYLSSCDGEVELEKLITGSSLQYFKTMGYTAKNKTLIKHLGPWKHSGVEKAIQKACGVIRDHKRPDKVALRAMAKKKKSSKEAEPLFTHMDNSVPTADFSHDEIICSEHIRLLNKKITPTCNDVLIGRGAFINNYIGNVTFRTFASQQKNRFDKASGSEKRAISFELVMLVKALDPPGRFLRRPHSAIHHPVPLSDGKYQLAPRGLEGPWEEVSLDTACLKVCQSMRDLKPEQPLSHSHDAKVYDQQIVQLGLAEYHLSHVEQGGTANMTEGSIQPPQPPQG